MKRLSVVFILLVAMVGFGFGVNRYINAQKSNLATQAAATPTQTHAVFSLPGTIYVAQSGKLFALTDGVFHLLETPNLGTWMQPHVLPDGTLLAVVRGGPNDGNYSDLYHLDAQGHVVAQLTKNHVSDVNAKLQLNHWVYWPTASADGSTVFAAHDLPKPAPGVSYAEDLSIWSGPLAGKVATTRWTTPDPYTGGDTDPQVMPNGGLIYVTYAIAADGHVKAQIGYQATKRTRTVLLTSPDDDCSAVAVAPDGVTLAMSCTSDSQSAKLEIAHFVDGKLDTPTVLVGNCLCNSPSWAPDGSGLLYLAPSDASGHFQLWWIKAAATTPQSPQMVTTNVDLDALSAASWFLPITAPTSSPTAPGP